MDSECQIVLYRKKNKVRLRGYDGQLLLWEVQSTLPEIREALLSAIADLEYQYKGLRDDILEPYLAYFINAKRKLK